MHISLFVGGPLAFLRRLQKTKTIIKIITKTMTAKRKAAVDRIAEKYNIKKQ